MQFPHPILLSAEVSLASKAQGVAPNTIALKNPNVRFPMEIHEISFDLRSDGVITGGAVACDLALGTIPLTNGYVPVWCFGRSRQTNREIGYGGNSATYFTGTWKLAKPLYIPPGGVVQPTFQHRGLVVDAINARITYRGQVLRAGARPPRTFAPYACAYSSKPFDVDAADTDASRETDLANPFSQPIFIQHMIGRMSVDINATSQKSEITDPAIAARLLQVRIIDSAGRPIVRDLSYFAQVFAKQTRAWDMNGAKIDGGEFYNVFLNKLEPPNDAAVTAATRYALADISLVGWREI